ncbi:methionine ABC transporter ATP-binding protein [Corynebacterium sp. H113]|uniref:methionine ABC transporter ATP-binding protein n=1 Tax=Corynebacterium sp. H113 TaxID=3133419 RepID=UPI00309A7D7B
MTRTGTQLEFRGLSKTFGDVTALSDVTLSVEPGEILGIIGYSGAGKSTLIRMINGLEKPTQGEVLLDGTDIARMPERKLRGLRRNIGMIFQHFNLFHSRTAAGNIAYPLELAGMPKKQRDERVRELLDFVGLADKGRNYPEQLSGGQKQRVGIARALATNPTLLLADEATSALDPETTADVLELLRRINREMGVTIVLITHDMSVVRAIADRMAIMENGRVVEHGSVHGIFSNPQTEVGRKFAATALRDRPKGRELDSVLGSAGRLVTVTLNDQIDLAAVLAAAHARGVKATVAHGSVSNVQEHAFGRLTLRLTEAAGDGVMPGDGAAVRATIAELSALTTVEELR